VRAIPTASKILCVLQDVGEHEVITALRTLFAVSRPGTFWAILALASPQFLRPYIQDLAYLCGDATSIDGARDVLYAAAQQLVAAYTEAKGLPAFPVDRELLGKGADMRPLPEGLVPSDKSVLAALVHARRKCVAHMSALHALKRGTALFCLSCHCQANHMSPAVHVMVCNLPGAFAQLLCTSNSRA
jgi:hypothetical protein